MVGIIPTSRKKRQDLQMPLPLLNQNKVNDAGAHCVDVLDSEAEMMKRS